MRRWTVNLELSWIFNRAFEFFSDHSKHLPITYSVFFTGWRQVWPLDALQLSLANLQLTFLVLWPMRISVSHSWPIKILTLLLCPVSCDGRSIYRNKRRMAAPWSWSFYTPVVNVDTCQCLDDRIGLSAVLLRLEHHPFLLETGERQFESG